MARKELTYNEFIKLAKENYINGGAVFVECWESYQFKDYTDIFGGITKKEALLMFEREQQYLFSSTRKPSRN